VDAAGFRSWIGAIEGIDYSHVVFSERDGIVSGLINAVGSTYRVRTSEAGTYLLERIDPAQLGAELDPLVVFGGAAAASGTSTNEAGNDVTRDGGTSVQQAQDAGDVIDVLLLYTPNARAAAGGSAQIQAIASQVISDTNTIYGRSGIVTRVRLAGTTDFALTEAQSMLTDLRALSDSPVAQSLRNAARADLVQLLVSSQDLTACGIAWLLPSLATADFPAYSVADIACVPQYTPTHEMGHSMGSHHAPEDGATGALFPYSYGFKDAARGFRTVMAYVCSAGISCPRIPNFSSPLQSHNGGVTGTDVQNNALSIHNAATTVANWRRSTAPGTPPSTPTGLRSQVAGATVSLFWDPLSGPSQATAYTLQVGTFSGASNLFNGNVGSTTTVSGAVGPGTYFWRVIATNDAGASAPSAESQVTVGTCVLPGTPTNFNFSLNGRVVTMHWSAPSAGGTLDVYIIEAGSAAGLADLFSGPTGSTVPVVVVEAPPGNFFVRVRAQNACGLSGPSNERLIVVQ
jgi:hypothetical protein